MRRGEDEGRRLPTFSILFRKTHKNTKKKRVKKKKKARLLAVVVHAGMAARLLSHRADGEGPRKLNFRLANVLVFLRGTFLLVRTTTTMDGCILFFEFFRPWCILCRA